jgi:hypothetical protein
MGVLAGRGAMVGVTRGVGTGAAVAVQPLTTNSAAIPSKHRRIGAGE